MTDTATRRQLLAGTAALVGGGALAAPARGAVPSGWQNATPAVVSVLATAEALSVVLHTVAVEKVPLDAPTARELQATAAHDLLHYRLLTSSAVDGRAATKSFAIPDEFLSSREALLSASATTKQILINAYLLATTVFARAGTMSGSRYARVAAEVAAVESVDRALAWQALGRLGSDRAYARFGDFTHILDAFGALRTLGYGIGEPTQKIATTYDFDAVAQRVPDVEGMNTLKAS